MVNDGGKSVLLGRYKILGGTLDRKPGEGDGEIQEVTHIFAHEHFNTTTLENDVALLRLASPIKDPDPTRRASIRLPSVSDTSWISEPYLAVRAQGWGNTERGSDSLYLKEVLLPLVEKDYCQEKFAIHGEIVGDGCYVPALAVVNLIHARVTAAGRWHTDPRGHIPNH